MTKISFDIDFSQDPAQILKEIQERAKAEVEKRESKERNSAYLSNLYKTVNEKLSTDFKSVSDLIRALTPYAAPALRDKLAATSASGRRKTISMSMDVYVEIKRLLTEPNPNKAAIARQTGASVVQVRKVADGGFDSKYGNSTSGKSSEKPESPSLPKFSTPSPLDEDSKVELVEEGITPPSLPSFSDEKESSLPPPASLDTPSPSAPLSQESHTSEKSDDLLPPLPQFSPAPFDSSEQDIESIDREEIPPIPSFGDEGEPSLPPPAPLGMNLPASTAEEIEVPTESTDQENAPPLPSFGDEEESSLPPPAPSGMAPPAPIAEEPQASVDSTEPEDAPSFPPSPPSPPPMSAKPLSSGSGFTRPPSGLKTTLKPTLGSGKKGKPTLSLKPKSKTSGLKITRPPMGGLPPPPSQ